MNDSTHILQQMEALADKRRNEIRNSPDEISIRGKSYYVSNAGSDDNDGTSPDSPWRTLKKVSDVCLEPGDGVLFRRGDLFRGEIIAQRGVTYAAYGSGAKPQLFGCTKNLADPGLWLCVDADHSIWKMKDKILDPGTLVFNEGEKNSRKLIPSYIGGKFVCRNDEAKDFCMQNEMTDDLDLYWDFDAIMTTRPSRGMDFPVPEMGPESLGDLYLRCDGGNPGDCFDSIEATERRSMFVIRNADGVHIDNLCIKYVGIHGIAAGGHVVGLHVTNCEFGWIGGTIQHYLGLDPNYPQGGRGTVTRYGNAVEIYGGCEDYLVSNCYIYQVYDAGITHQVTTNGKEYHLSGIRYLNNLVERCVYAIEYFLDMNEGDTASLMKDIRMQGNLLRLSGYGWGQQRHNVDTPALIKGWSYVNAAADYAIEDNIFDRCAYRLLHLVAQKQESCPVMRGNTYIQDRNGMLGQYGGNEVQEPGIIRFDNGIKDAIHHVLGDAEAKVYTV